MTPAALSLRSCVLTSGCSWDVLGHVLWFWALRSELLLLSVWSHKLTLALCWPIRRRAVATPCPQNPFVTMATSAVENPEGWPGVDRVTASFLGVVVPCQQQSPQSRTELRNWLWFSTETLTL